MTISEKAVNKPTTILTIFILIIAFGVMAMKALPIDLLPDIDIPYMIVYTTYKNAGPEEVEQNITRTLESSLSGVSGTKKLISVSSTGTSMIMIEFNYGSNLDEAAMGIRDKIDMVRRYLPEDADTPITLRLDPSMMPVLTLVLRGARTPEELRTYSEDIIQKRLEQLDGVASVGISGGREKAIAVDIPRDRLEAYSLTVSQVAQMIGAQNIQAAGGSIESGDTKYAISSVGKFNSLEEVKNTAISYKYVVDGGLQETRKVYLRDIADVYEGYKDESSKAQLDGESAVMLMIQKQSGKNSVATAKKVRKAIAELKKELPGDVELIETSNTTDEIERTINEVANSVIVGALLAVLVLFVFLRNIKSTIIIGLTIPISLMCTLALMYLKGMTLNMMTLAGLLIGVGMLVDNSIVILENIFSYREKGSKPRAASILGASEMVNAIVSSTMTTVCIFLPMILFKQQLGMMGQMFNDFAFTIVLSLICSLVVAIVLVPVLTSKYLKLEATSSVRRDGFVGKLNTAATMFFDKLDSKYAGAISKVLRHRKLTMCTVILLFIGSIALVPVMGFVFMPEENSDSLKITVEMPKGTKLDKTEEVLQQFESIVMQEIKGVKFRTVYAGSTGMMSASSSDTNSGAIQLTFYPKSEREPDWDTFKTAKDKLRKYFDRFPGAKFSFSSGSGQNTGNSGIKLDIRCDDLDKLRSINKEVLELIKDQCGDLVTEPSSDLEDGQPQISIIFDRQRMSDLGLTVYSVGNEIKANINGTTATRYEYNGKEIDMIVRLAEQDRQRMVDLDNLFVTSNKGIRIPLSSFARNEETTSAVAIRRQNQGRMATITATPVKGKSLGVVQAEVDKIIKANIPQDEAVQMSWSGDLADMIDSVLKFGLVIILAAVLVFSVMASQFENYLDPFIIIFTMPLAFIGVSAIYFIKGEQLNFVTVVGLLMLVGIIVNNGIVLVDYTNLVRKRMEHNKHINYDNGSIGDELAEACIEAARSRLRPILMSTLTTVISLIPMALFPGEGAAMIQPISLTTLGGLSFGSLMTLFVMPTLYYSFNARRIKKAAKKAAKRAAKAAGKKYEKTNDKINKRALKIAMKRAKLEAKMADLKARLDAEESQSEKIESELKKQNSENISNEGASDGTEPEGDNN